MPKTSGDFTPEQREAMALAVVDGQMTAAQVKAAAKAGELGDFGPFDPSVATVSRCAATMREERAAQTPAERYRASEVGAYDMLDAMAREIWAEKKDKGQMNAVKVKAYAAAVRMIGANLGKSARQHEGDESEAEPEGDPRPTKPALLQRLATQPAAQRTAAQHNGTAAEHAGSV